MAKKINLKEILEKGSPKQKALLIIQNDEESERIKGGFLTDREVDSIRKSLQSSPDELREFNKYLKIADKYAVNRFRIYALQENLKKLSAKIAAYTFLWELAEKEAETLNTILGLLDNSENKGKKEIPHRADIEKYIYTSGANWHRWLKLKKKDNSRELEVDVTLLKKALDDVIADYTFSLSVAKAFTIASDKFVERYNASAFIPSDVSGMFDYFKSPNTDVPDLYRRDVYLSLLKEKGEEDREVQYRKKYAILPSYEEIEPLKDTHADKVFSL